MTIRRAITLAGLGAACALSITATPAPTPVVVLANPPVVERHPFTGVEVFEDGSGVQYVSDVEVRTFPADTFVWDCRSMGNLACFPRELSSTIRSATMI